MTDLPPPVGEACPHTRFDPSPMQLPNYRKADGGEWIYYHGLEIIKNKLYICAKPEPWRWKRYLRYCGECGQIFSNPWVPICDACWPSLDMAAFPSWDRVIRLDMRL